MSHMPSTGFLRFGDTLINLANVAYIKPLAGTADPVGYNIYFTAADSHGKLAHLAVKTDAGVAVIKDELGLAGNGNDMPTG